MRIRHHIPSIFNLAMVDVLCCALGCVILLWLVNFREAKQRAQAASRSAAGLTERLRQAEARADQADVLKTVAQGYRGRAADLDARVQTLERTLRLRDLELAGARRRADALADEKQSLASQANRERAAA